MRRTNTVKKKKVFKPYKNLGDLYTEAVQGEPPISRVASPAIEKPERMTSPKLAKTKIISFIQNKFQADLEALNRVEGIALPNSSANIVISSNDIEVWQKLYPVKLLTIDNTRESQGSGSGEAAVAWFLNQNSEYNGHVEDNRFGGQTDLLVNNIGVEVKSYSSKMVKLGKFNSIKDQDIIYVLNYIFGFGAVFNKLNNDTLQNNESVNFILKEYAAVKDTHFKSHAGNFNGSILVAAIKALAPIVKLFDSKELKQIITGYNLQAFTDILNKLNYINKQLGGNVEWDKPEVIAKKIMLRLVTAKLNVKPGINGYIINCNQSGKLSCSKYNPEILVNEFELDDARVSNTELSLNINKVLGPNTSAAAGTSYNSLR